MAVTRIKTNQVTDSAITTDKLGANAVTAAKLEDNLTYGSNLTITGNLTVNGTTSQVNSTTMTVDDPVLLLSEGQTGAGAVDIGFMGERGDDTNVAFVWDESADEFVAALVSDSDTSTTVTITDYADIRVGGLTVDDNATIGGTLGVTGNVTLSGDITFGGSSTIDANTNKIVNVVDPTTDQDAATKAYVDSVASSGFTVTDGSNSQVIEINGDTLTINGTANEITTLVSATDTLTIGLPDNVTIGDALTVTGAASVGSTLDVTGLASLDGGIDVDGAFTVADTSGNVATTGSITGGSLTDGTATLSSGALSGATTGAFSSNVTVGGTLGVSGESTLASATISDLTSGRVVLAGTSGAVEDSANLTFDGSTLDVSGDIEATGDLGGATATVTGNATVGGTLGVTGATTLSSTLGVTGDATFSGDISNSRIRIRENTITTLTSNEPLVLSTNGLGNVRVDEHLSLQAQITDPVAVSGFSTVFSRTFASTTRAFHTDSDGDVVAIAPREYTPASAVGATGDRKGDMAWDSDYIYTCTANYDGSTAIWRRAAHSTW